MARQTCESGDVEDGVMQGWRRLRKLAFLFIGLVLAIALANCDGTPPPQSSPTSTVSPSPTPSALVFGSVGQPVSLDPGTITDGNSVVVQEQLYNRLLDFQAGGTELEPSLATEWRVSEDGLNWTFQLRQGVTFHDGTEFNAEAVRFNVLRWWDPEFEYGDRNAGKLYEIWANLFGGYRGSEASLLEDVVVEDPYTIRFVLKRPFAAFPAALASGYFGIASPTAIQESRASYGTPSVPAVGTGPFRFRDWRSGDRIVLEGNPTYWKPGLPRSDQLVITFVEDPSARLAQLRSGSLDFTVELTPDQLPEIERDANLELVLRRSFNVGYLALNPSYEPLADPIVRLAIAQAINKEAIVEAFWGDLGQADAHFLPPVLAEFQSSAIEDYQYSPEQARRLLETAGYPDGFDLDLWYMPVSRPYFPNPKPIAEALAAELSAIGIRPRLRTQDWGAYLDNRNRPPGFQSFMLGWIGDYGDPDNFYYAHFGPGSTADLGGWQNPRLLELLNQGRTETDETERQRIYAEIDEILFDEAVRLPIVHAQPLLAQRASLVGWQPSPFGAESFEQVEKR